MCTLELFSEALQSYCIQFLVVLFSISMGNLVDTIHLLILVKKIFSTTNTFDVPLHDTGYALSYNSFIFRLSSYLITFKIPQGHRAFPSLSNNTQGSVPGSEQALNFSLIN